MAISRASHEAHIYTNDSTRLGKRLSTDVSKTAAIDLSRPTAKNEVERAVTAFREGNPATAATILQQDERVHQFANAEHRLAAVALAYASREDRVVVVAPDAGERKELTQLIRDEQRQRGRLSTESHVLPVWVEQHFGNPCLAANYVAGDQIRYKSGGLEHGIVGNSTATILSVDAKANRLTVGALDGSEVSYNPALLRTLTGQGRVFREELREISEGERIVFIATAQQFHIRKGDFATVERIGEDRSLTVRTDQGKLIALPDKESRQIDYGYTADRMPRHSMDRVIVSGEAPQIAQLDFARLSGQTRDLELYTSQDQKPRKEKSAAATPEKNTSIPLPAIESALEHAREGFGRGR